MKLNIGRSEKDLKAVANSLNILLADEHVLYIKTRNYHWNVEGSNFLEIHKFYEGQYDQLSDTIDEIAERIRAIGQYSEGRLKDFLKITNLEEQAYTSDQKIQIQNLLNDHETIIRRLLGEVEAFTDEYKDPGSADFITSIIEMHEKMAWMLRSYLK
ncbi:MAG: DNA starvation/stationary phase protection protein [Chitinophagaceae bacterium]|nr:DNA starvation/stationary phase protection protein [Chitinophagaceae bacterium]